jgi:hypothetical protein
MKLHFVLQERTLHKLALGSAAEREACANVNAQLATCHAYLDPIPSLEEGTITPGSTDDTIATQDVLRGVELARKEGMQPAASGNSSQQTLTVLAQGLLAGEMANIDCWSDVAEDWCNILTVLASKIVRSNC